MKTLSALWFSLRSLVLRTRADAELDEELAFHIEREAAMYEREGMSHDDARREAIKQFGGVQRYREECRDVRRTTLLDDTVGDARFALRLIRLHPGFAANVILISALGIAVCTSTFSVVSGVLFSPLPFADADRVAAVQLLSSEGRSSAAFPMEAYARIASDTSLIDAIAAFRPRTATIEWNDAPERVRPELVTPSFFRVFGITPVVGRAFTPAEADERVPVVMLGHEFWQSRFGANPNVIGKRVTIDSAVYTIVGVTPRQFRAHLTSEPDMWLPMPVSRAASSDATVNAVLRTRDGVSRERAEAWAASFVHAKLPSNTTTDSVAASASLVPISELIFGYLRRPLMVFLGAVLLVLTLVAANVTTMFLARSTARERELGVRRALGASTGRQLRQMVTESTTLTMIGGALGLIASYWLVGGIRGLGVRVLPRMDSVALDWRVLLFAVAGTVLTGVVAGLIPAWSANRSETARNISGARVTGRRTPSLLVVAQITLSVVLLVSAGLFMKSFLRVLPTDPGFALDNRATLTVSLSGQAAFPDSDRTAVSRFVAAVDERMRRINGVRDVAVMSFLPFSGMVSTTQIQLPNLQVPTKPLTAFQNFVTPNFFQVMRIDLRRGRAFTASDDGSSARVAIVNETAAARWWPGENPIGKQLSAKLRERITVTVVGVSRDGRINGTDTRIRPEIFFPVAQGQPRALSFIAQTTTDPRTVAPELRRAVWTVAPHLAVGTTTDLATIAAQSVSTTRFFTVAMATFAVAAVSLSALAVYGLLAFAVTQRRREIGIRLALGATPRSVGAMVVRTALVLGITGVVVGAAIARALSRFLESILLEVSATDATVYVAMGTAALIVAVLAACVPAYEAVRVDPVASLREG